MTIQDLNNYRKRQQEIEDIQLELNSNHYAADTVTTCTPPSYTQHSKRVEGYLPDGNTLSLLMRLSGLKERQRACEEYINGIEDYQTRKMFYLHFVKGKTFVQTAIECGLGGNIGCVKMRIKRYLQKR